MRKKQLLFTVLFSLLLLGTGASQTAAQTAGSFKGQIVCSECWFEASDRKATPYGTDADLKCALRCDKGNIPMALAVWEGDKASLFILEPGKFTPEGGSFVNLVPKQVEISGSTRTEGEKRFLKVDALKVADGSAAGPTSEAAPAQAIAIGSSAPELALPDLSGAAQSLGGYRGKNIVILNFWATWCAPCRKEMPAFVAIQNEYAAWGVQVVAASTDAPETQPQIGKFVRQAKLNFPIWTGASIDDMAKFGLGAELPGTIVIDREGRIAARFKGIVDEAKLKAAIEEILKKQEKASARSMPRQHASSVPA